MEEELGSAGACDGTNACHSVSPSPASAFLTLAGTKLCIRLRPLGLHCKRSESLLPATGNLRPSSTFSSDTIGELQTEQPAMGRMKLWALRGGGSPVQVDMPGGEAHLSIWRCLWVGRAHLSIWTCLEGGARLSIWKC